jgi:hypothetical protein
VISRAGARAVLGLSAMSAMGQLLNSPSGKRN